MTERPPITTFFWRGPAHGDARDLPPEAQGSRIAVRMVPLPEGHTGPPTDDMLAKAEDIVYHTQPIMDSDNVIFQVAYLEGGRPTLREMLQDRPVSPPPVERDLTSDQWHALFHIVRYHITITQEHHMAGIPLDILSDILWSWVVATDLEGRHNATPPT